MTQLVKSLGRREPPRTCRLFNGTSDALQAASVNLTAYSAISLVFFLWWDAFGANSKMAFEFSSDYSLSQFGFVIMPNAPTGGGFRVALNGNVGQSTADFTRPSAAAWHQYVINLDKGKSSGEIDSVYVDGASQSLSVVNDANNTNAFGNLPLNFMSRNYGAGFQGAGRLARVAIYGGATSAADAGLLAEGRSPQWVNPGALLHCWMLDGRASVESDLRGGRPARVKGARPVERPPAWYPQQRAS